MAEPTGPRADRTAQDVADLVARLRRAMRRAARVAQPSMALSVAQLEFLTAIAEDPGSTPGAVAERLRLAHNSVSTLANAMVHAGMVARSSGRTDRRTVRYTLTTRGTAMVESWRDTNGVLLGAAIRELSATERRTLTVSLPVLARLVDLVDAQADPPGAGAADPRG